MNTAGKVNYDRLMTEEIEKLKGEGKTPALVLHACCAPCASVATERLNGAFNIRLYFYNPNIDGEKEFSLREKEVMRLAEKDGVNFTAEPFYPSEFYSAVKGFEGCHEGGERCLKCFYLRLKKTAEYAEKEGADYFSTTLTTGPKKNAEIINSIGFRVEKETGVKFLPCDFKKRGGFYRSVERCRIEGFYRQNYCGCVFSKQGRQTDK